MSLLNLPNVRMFSIGIFVSKKRERNVKKKRYGTKKISFEAEKTDSKYFFCFLISVFNSNVE